MKLSVKELRPITVFIGQACSRPRNHKEPDWRTLTRISEAREDTRSNSTFRYPLESGIVGPHNGQLSTIVNKKEFTKWVDSRFGFVVSNAKRRGPMMALIQKDPCPFHCFLIMNDGRSLLKSLREPHLFCLDNSQSGYF